MFQNQVHIQFSRSCLHSFQGNIFKELLCDQMQDLHSGAFDGRGMFNGQPCLGERKKGKCEDVISGGERKRLEVSIFGSSVVYTNLLVFLYLIFSVCKIHMWITSTEKIRKESFMWYRLPHSQELDWDHELILHYPLKTYHLVLTSSHWRHELDSNQLPTSKWLCLYHSTSLQSHEILSGGHSISSVICVLSFR